MPAKPEAPEPDDPIGEWAEYARAHGIIVSQGRVNKAEILTSLQDEEVLPRTPVWGHDEQAGGSTVV